MMLRDLREADYAARHFESTDRMQTIKKAANKLQGYEEIGSRKINAKALKKGLDHLESLKVASFLGLTISDLESL